MVTLYRGYPRGKVALEGCRTDAICERSLTIPAIAVGTNGKGITSQSVDQPQIASHLGELRTDTFKPAERGLVYIL